MVSTDMDFSEVKDLFMLKAQVKGLEYLPPSVKERILKGISEEVTKRALEARESNLSEEFSEGLKKVIKELNISDCSIGVVILYDGSISELRFKLGVKSND